MLLTLIQKLDRSLHQIQYLTFEGKRARLHGSLNSNAIFFNPYDFRLIAPNEQFLNLLHLLLINVDSCEVVMILITTLYHRQMIPQFRKIIFRAAHTKKEETKIEVPKPLQMAVRLIGLRIKQLFDTWKTIMCHNYSNTIQIIPTIIFSYRTHAKLSTGIFDFFLNFFFFAELFF